MAKLETTPRCATIVVLGGAGNAKFSDEHECERQLVLRRALLAGWDKIQEGSKAVDAVEAAVTVMENSRIFNAGLGSCLTKDGTIEMDAFIMDGQGQTIGSVGSVSRVPNPLKLARAVMDYTPHCMFVGTEAENLASEQLGFSLIDSSSFITPISKQKLKKTLDHECDSDYESDSSVMSTKANTRSFTKSAGTSVGAIALDRFGNVAVATSTGGLMGKFSGRLGDAPLPGCSGWADNESCAVCVLGRGEPILRTCLAHRCSVMYESKPDPKEVAKEALKHLKRRGKYVAGLAIVDKRGEIAIDFSTERMAWVYCRDGDDNIHYGTKHREDLTESLQSTRSEVERIEQSEVSSDKVPAPVAISETHLPEPATSNEVPAKQEAVIPNEVVAGPATVATTEITEIMKMLLDHSKSMNDRLIRMEEYSSKLRVEQLDNTKLLDDRLSRIEENLKSGFTDCNEEIRKYRKEVLKTMEHMDDIREKQVSIENAEKKDSQHFVEGQVPLPWVLK